MTIWFWLAPVGYIRTHVDPSLATDVNYKPIDRRVT